MTAANNICERGGIIYYRSSKGCSYRIVVDISRYAAINQGGDKSSGVNRRRPHLCTLGGHESVSGAVRPPSWSARLVWHFCKTILCATLRDTAGPDCGRKKLSTSGKNTKEKEKSAPPLLRYYRPLVRPFISTKFDIPSSRNARCGLVCRILLRSLSVSNARVHGYRKVTTISSSCRATKSSTVDIWSKHARGQAYVRQPRFR